MEVATAFKDETTWYICAINQIGIPHQDCFACVNGYIKNANSSVHMGRSSFLHSFIFRSFSGSEMRR